MAENSAIEWTDATVNFWWGCTKVGPGCDHCYAETWSKRTGESIWGVGAPRRKIKGAPALLAKLSAKAPAFHAEHGRERRVFIQSMSDLFDNEVSLDWFADAWSCIERAPKLSIQIVTKRVSIVEKRLAAIGRKAWPLHAGLLISVVNQEEANRDVPRLLALKERMRIPWVGISAEPLLGPINFTHVFDGMVDGIPTAFDSLSSGNGFSPRLDWIIVGGESGPGARPMHPDWARLIRDQCAAAGVPFLFKQWGEWRETDGPKAGADRRKIPGGTHWLKRDGALIGGGSPLGRLLSPYGDYLVEKMGKKVAGRLLDGVTHDGFPRSAP